MKFTKQNIERIFDKFMQGGDSLADLKEQILNLADTPEKVVVPKFVADYLEDCKKRNIKLASALCPFKNGYGKEIELWFDNEDNNRLFSLAWINGYEVEKQLYAVRGLTDYFRLDNKVILFNDKQKAFDIANKIGECCEIEVFDCSSDLNFILISEIRNGL